MDTNHETIRLRRKPEQWRMTVPKSVVDGSPAQAMYCIADAKADIATLLEEVERLRAALELATSLFNDTGYLQRKADYARGHLSYHNSIAEQEAPIRKALEGEKS